MSDCTCPWEATIKKNQSLLTGNGNKGVVRELEEVKGEMKHMNRNFAELSKMMGENHKELSQSYRILAKSMESIDVKEKIKMELKRRRGEIIKRLGTVFGIVFGLLGALYMILDHLNI